MYMYAFLLIKVNFVKTNFEVLKVMCAAIKKINRLGWTRVL